MKFGKLIQSQQVPGWSTYYLDYKFLKKIISSLAANRPGSEAAALAVGVRPPEIPPSTPPTSSPLPVRTPTSILENDPGRPPIFSVTGQDGERGPDFRAHKAAFFFKLERELEKINAFYLQKEAELTLRLETLLSKRRAAAMRGLPDSTDDRNVEWSAVSEGFRHLERELGKLQQFVEINATGFRKILKKFDKRSKSTTKELYLARQVDVQPVFNRQLISELSDTVAGCLLDITDLSSGLKFEGSAATDIFTQQILVEQPPAVGPLHDFENNLRKAVATSDREAIQDCIKLTDFLSQDGSGKTNITRILWNLIIEAPPHLADLILASLSPPFDFCFLDDINGRTCLHEAAIAGTPRLVDLCLQNGVQQNKTDVYGRNALHYAAMNGHASICKRLLEVGLPPDTLDRDNYSPLVYATLRGSVDCVTVLLADSRVPVTPTAPPGDVIPLSLASQSGHVEVVLILLQHGAECLPNSNGEYPMHLAARDGHIEVCKLLLHHNGWDTPDKYHEWTPLFHATRYGRLDCVVLLLQAGARPYILDELGHLPVHYAAWYGHPECLNVLLAATRDAPTSARPVQFQDSPRSDLRKSAESEIDLIPSLSLPPPIMPHRMYGHNYLDKHHLVQVTVGHSHHESNRKPGVRLHHRLINAAFKDEYIVVSPPLKLVMTCPNVAAAPYTMSLPQKGGTGTFTFQIPSLDSLLLEFSIYPNFGTKTIGRAVALPSLFSGSENGSFTLPILDNRLHVVGEVDFDINVITPFDGVTLEVGGDVETYWKSLATPVANAPQLSVPRWSHRSSLISSAHTSPSTHSVKSNAERSLTISSLHGSYVSIMVQVTRDLHPVVYANLLLPEPNFELAVCDVTLVQFEALARREGRQLEGTGHPPTTEWPALIEQSMLSLAQLLKVLPLNVGISLDLAYPAKKGNSLSIGYTTSLNTFVDSVLRTIYHTSAALDNPLERRRIMFTSFSSDVCSALNWKQPNYPVFFATPCGKHSTISHHVTDLESDFRNTSVGAAVEVAKTNNLLGIFVDADLLVQVPSLIQGIRNAGLLVGIHGVSGQFVALTTSSSIEGSPIDTYMVDGMVVFVDHLLQELL